MPATILVAEDEPDILALLAAVLEEEGYRVLRARDGVAALALLRREHPDLLLTDNRMPGLRGTDLVARMRAEPQLAVPTVLLTAYAPALPPPGVTVIPKPFDVERVLAAVARRLPAP